MANVKFYRGDSEFIKNLPIKDGQLVYDTQLGKSYVDVGFKRVETSGGAIDDEVVNLKSTHSSAKNNQDYANALIRTVQGEAIAVDDVSPLEHEVKCTVSGVPDLSKVTVTQTTANLFDEQAYFSKIGYKFVDGAWTGTNTVETMYINTGRLKLKHLVCDFKSSITNAITFIIHYTDGTAQYTMQSPTDWANNVIEFNQEKTVDYIEQTYGDTGTVYIKNVMISLSDFSYEPAKVTTFTPSPSGTVSGMTSLSPNMTVMTDTPGALLDVEYNADVNKVLEKKDATIQTLADRISALENRIELLK